MGERRVDEGGSSRLGRRALLSRGAIAGAALAALVPVDPAAATPPPGGTYDLRTSFGARGDGVTNDSPALQAALNALSADGGGELHVSNGTYRIAGPVLTNYTGKATSIVIRGQGSASQILIATGAANTAITVQNLDSVLIEDVTFLGTPRPNAVQTDALVTLRFDTCIQATLRRCDFYGISSYVAGGAVVLANGSDLHIEDSAFRGCGASAGLGTSVVTSQSWTGLTISNTDFIDYGYLHGYLPPVAPQNPPDFFSKTPTAPPWAWVGLANVFASHSPPAGGAVLLTNVTMDEGAQYGLACLPTSSSLRIESLTISGLRINVAGFRAPNNGVTIQGVDHVLIERSWFGYESGPTGYSSRNAISLHGVQDAVIDACRCDAHAEIIVADSTVGTVTVRESSYKYLRSTAASTQVIQGGITARLLQADGSIAANGLVVASPTTALRVIAAPAGAPASAVLGVALDATFNVGDSTRVVTTRGTIVAVRSDGAAAITPGDPVGPSAVASASCAKISSGGLIGRAVQAAAAGPDVLVNVELIDGLVAGGGPQAPALQGGWANAGNGFAGAGYTMTADKRVELTGLISGGATASGTVVLTLPAGYRPPAGLVFPVASSGGYAEIAVTADGNVAIRQLVGSSGSLSLSGVRFAAA